MFLCLKKHKKRPTTSLTHCVERRFIAIYFWLVWSVGGGQCDHIELFLEFLGNKFYYKADQMFDDFLDSCENNRFLSQTGDATFWATFVKTWATFYFNIWSHWTTYLPTYLPTYILIFNLSLVLFFVFCRPSPSKDFKLR